MKKVERWNYWQVW